jgi:hypothetical protein
MSDKIQIMLRSLIASLALAGGLMGASDFDQTQAARFAKLALDCVHQEYPTRSRMRWPRTPT